MAGGVSETHMPSGRFTGLDAVRGLAAISVLVYHALLTVPALEASPPWNGAVDWAWLASHTPLRAAWAGGAAVTLFFVLSGFVLTVAAARPDSPGWADYYPRRLLRLYLPAAAAIVLASFWITLAPRVAPADATWWLRGTSEPTPKGIAKDLSLFWEPGSTTSVLWSLTWEVAFSLLLPVYLFVVIRTKRLAGPGLVAAVGLCVLGEAIGSTALTFLPVFAIGCYLAIARERLPRLVAPWWRGSRSRRIVIVFVVMQAFSLPFLLTGFGLATTVWTALGTTSLLAACTAIVALGVVVPIPAGGSIGGVLSWLGSRSFSLYLVHEPIIVSIAILGADDLSPWWTLPISLPVSLVVAEIFYRSIERPVTAFSRTFSLPRIRRISPRPPLLPPGRSYGSSGG